MSRYGLLVTNVCQLITDDRLVPPLPLFFYTQIIFKNIISKHSPLVSPPEGLAIKELLRVFKSLISTQEARDSSSPDKNSLRINSKH